MKKVKGFTLIELLIVVAIIGILAALLIPNAITAIQKSRQKATMKDIVSIATACADYVTDNGTAPDAGTQSGDITNTGAFVTGISPFYIRVCPVEDQWGNTLQVYTGTAGAAIGGITAAMLGDEDFIIHSTARKGVDESFSFNPSQPDSGLFTVNSMDDFEKDLINWSGSWIRAPRTAVE